MINSNRFEMKKSLIAGALQIGYLLPSLIQFYYITYSSNYKDPLLSSIQFYTLGSVAVFYAFYLWLFPKFLYKRRVGAFTLYGVLIILIGVIFSTLSRTYFVSHSQKDIYPSKVIEIVNFASRYLFAGIVACVIRGFVTWLGEIRYKQQLERKNQEASFALLKAQINPHFLFNTLNNIDVLIEREPAKASAYLKKLSDILRFTLYESPIETITLQREVEYINEYVELQKIRTSNPDFVTLNASGDVQDAMVAPMLFIPFIENAFKHCTNKKLSGAINIHVGVYEQTITFSCDNAYDNSTVSTQEKSGLGLDLIRTRLELLYKHRYSLDINKTAERFIVNLTINLHDNH